MSGPCGRKVQWSRFSAQTIDTVLILVKEVSS
jgi:hypothetical protein